MRFGKGLTKAFAWRYWDALNCLAVQTATWLPPSRGRPELNQSKNVCAGLLSLSDHQDVVLALLPGCSSALNPKP